MLCAGFRMMGTADPGAEARAGDRVLRNRGSRPLLHSVCPAQPHGRVQCRAPKAQAVGVAMRLGDPATGVGEGVAPRIGVPLALSFAAAANQARTGDDQDKKKAGKFACDSWARQRQLLIPRGINRRDMSRRFPTSAFRISVLKLSDALVSFDHALCEPGPLNCQNCARAEQCGFSKCRPVKHQSFPEEKT